MGKIEQFIMEYGEFRTYRDRAYSSGSRLDKRSALSALQRMFTLISESEVKKKFPILYKNIEGDKREVEY